MRGETDTLRHRYGESAGFPLDDFIQGVGDLQGMLPQVDGVALEPLQVAAKDRGRGEEIVHCGFSGAGEHRSSDRVFRLLMTQWTNRRRRR